jgi:signal transduction histidine kinase
VELALRSAEAPLFEYELALGNEVRQFEGRAVACDRDSAIVIARDVTAGRRSAEALRQAQKLESLEALAGGIAHDFNNILSAILGQASLGLGRLGLDSPARPHVIKVIDATERAADIARKMLDYSGHGSVQTRHSDLSQVVDESRSLLEAALPKHVVLGWELAPDLPRVRVDIGQVQHALANLTLNAVEALGDEPGHLTVRTALRTIEPHDARFWRYTAEPLPPGPYVVLEVEDDGPGIEAPVLARLFEPFFTAKVAGRGLGLAVVLGIVRGHRGGVAVESKRGSTRFELAFPLTGETLPPSPTRSASARTVLVVDDEAMVRDAVVAILTSEGVPVKSARNTDEAAQILRSGGLDIGLVILDFSMPGMSGAQAYPLFRAIVPGLPVVLSSGFTEEEALHRFSGFDLAGFLQKPYRPADLMAHVRRWVPQD